MDCNWLRLQGSGGNHNLLYKYYLKNLDESNIKLNLIFRIVTHIYFLNGLIYPDKLDDKVSHFA